MLSSPQDTGSPVVGGFMLAPFRVNVIVIGGIEIREFGCSTSLVIGTGLVVGFCFRNCSSELVVSISITSLSFVISSSIYVTSVGLFILRISLCCVVCL